MSRKPPQPATSDRAADREVLFAQLKQIAQGLGETFAPFCEVVVHDLTDPKNAIVAIHNNLSGREVGQPATELGLARIADPDYPQVIANYANTFADGRQAKSTSVGIKDADGRYVAALCLNVDLTLFQNLQSAIGQFTSVDAQNGPRESLNPARGGRDPGAHRPVRGPARDDAARPEDGGAPDVAAGTQGGRLPPGPALRGDHRSPPRGFSRHGVRRCQMTISSSCSPDRRSSRC